MDTSTDLNTLVQSIMAHYAAATSDVYDHSEGVNFDNASAALTNAVTDAFFRDSRQAGAGLAYVHDMLEPQPSDPHYEVPYEKRMSILVGCVAGLGVARSGLNVFSDLDHSGTRYRSIYYALEARQILCDGSKPHFTLNDKIPGFEQLTEALNPYVASRRSIPPEEDGKAFSELMPELCLPTALGKKATHALMWSVLWGVHRAEHPQNPDWPVIRQAIRSIVPAKQ